MEKIAIQLWKNLNLDAIDFKNFLINEVPRSLKDHISSYQVNLADEDVKEGCPKRFSGLCHTPEYWSKPHPNKNAAS